jgi:hypothetical protein
MYAYINTFLYTYIKICIYIHIHINVPLSHVPTDLETRIHNGLRANLPMRDAFMEAFCIDFREFGQERPMTKAFVVNK